MDITNLHDIFINKYTHTYPVYIYLYVYLYV